ncbi:MAG: nucleoside phosphorylase [Clostridia bacterium]|nr:nucleoside phosphorylase [Clostridia bacterium]
MILDEFDNEVLSVINPSASVNNTIKNFPQTAVTFYSQALMEKFVDLYHPKKIAELSHSSGIFPIYLINENGVDIAVYRSMIGAPASVLQFEEMIALGVKNLVAIGSCGCLDKSIEEFSIIIPHEAVRDEGTSYHYYPKNDEIRMNARVVKVLEKVLRQRGNDFIKAKTWTNDAFYRETKAKVNRRRSMGCRVVDMECSAMIAVARFRKVNFGQLFYSADNLDSDYWDPRHLRNYSLNTRYHMIPLAIACAKQMHIEMPPIANK